MAEYIEREAAFNAVLKLVPKVDDDGYCWVIRGDAAKAVDSIPAADVAPIICCRDCRFWSKNYPEDGYGWCSNYVAGTAERSENFFCAVGVGKENGR